MCNKCEVCNNSERSYLCKPIVVGKYVLITLISCLLVYWFMFVWIGNSLIYNVTLVNLFIIIFKRMTCLSHDYDLISMGCT